MSNKSSDKFLDGLKVLFETYEIPRLQTLAIPIWNVLFINLANYPEVRSYRAQTKEEAIKKCIHQTDNNCVLQLIDNDDWSCDLINKNLDELRTEFRQLLGKDYEELDDIYYVEPNGKIDQWLTENETDLIQLLNYFKPVDINLAEDGESMELCEI